MRGTESVVNISPNWFYQRFVNVVMQRCHPRCRKIGEGPEGCTHPWYRKEVEGSEMVAKGSTNRTVLGFTFMAPLLFPFVYGAALLWLPFQVIKLSHILPVLRTWMISAMYLLCACFPLYLLWRGHFDKEEFKLPKAVDVHISMFSSGIVTVACFLAGFRMTHAIQATACDCACQTHLQSLEKDPQYGKALSKVVEVLSDRADPWSNYPFFHRTSFNRTGSLSWTAWITLVIISVAFGFAPHVETAISHHERLFPTTDVEMWVLLFNINLGPTYAIFMYLSKFHKASMDYRRVVKSVRIFIYLGANDTDKHQGVLKTDYKETMIKCDSERKPLINADVQAFEKGTERRDEMRKLGLNMSTTTGKKNELDILKVTRVAINFSIPRGIIFYRRLRAWLITDMHNERAHINMYVNMSLLGAFLSSILLIGAVVYTNRDVKTVWEINFFNTLVRSVVPPLIVMSVYILWSAHYFADANKYLFDYYKCILLGWKTISMTR